MDSAAFVPNSPPGPPPAPVLGWRGNALQFSRDPLGYVRSVYQRYGPVSALAEDEPRCVFAIGPAYNRQLLADPDLFRSPIDLLNLPPTARTALDRLAAGWLNRDESQSRVERQLIQPLEHYVDQHRDTVVTITRQMLDRWGIGQLVDVHYVTRRLMLSITLQALFGLDDPQEQTRLGGLLSRWDRLIFAPSVMLFSADVPGTPLHRMRELSSQIEAEIGMLIRRKRDGQDGDLLSVLIALINQEAVSISDATLIRYVVRATTTVYSLTAGGLMWTLLLLSQHLQALDDLHAELQASLHGGAPTIEQLTRLPLLERVITESLRLLPPLSIGVRVSAAAVELGSYRIPQGATIVYSPYLTQHMPELYVAPERFRPERWIHIEPSPYKYLPFGDVPGGELGASLAVLTMKLVLATLMQRCHLALAPGVQIDRGHSLTLVPKDGLPMIIAPADRPLIKREVRGNLRDLVLFP